MPKIIQMAFSPDDHLYVLYDDGRIFRESYNGNWVNNSLPIEPPSPAPPNPDSWKEFRRKMRATVPANGYYWCAVCNKSIFRYDSAALKSCWKVGHFVGREIGK